MEEKQVKLPDQFLMQTDHEGKVVNGILLKLKEAMSTRIEAVKDTYASDPGSEARRVAIKQIKTEGKKVETELESLSELSKNAEKLGQYFLSLAHGLGAVESSARKLHNSIPRGEAVANAAACVPVADLIIGMSKMLPNDASVSELHKSVRQKMAANLDKIETAQRWKKIEKCVFDADADFTVVEIEAGTAIRLETDLQIIWNLFKSLMAGRTWDEYVKFGKKKKPVRKPVPKQQPRPRPRPRHEQKPRVSTDPKIKNAKVTLGDVTTIQ